MSAFSDIEGRLTEKAGPIPVWGWVAVAIGGWYLYNARKKAASANSPTQTTASSTGATSAGQTSNTGDQGYAGAQLAQGYDYLNALGVNTSELGILNSSVGSNTTAQAANTAATTTNTAATNSNTTAQTLPSAPSLSNALNLKNSYTRVYQSNGAIYGVFSGANGLPKGQVYHLPGPTYAAIGGKLFG